METFDVSVIIACYNEEPILEQSVQQLFEVLDRTTYKYELIFVDDVSQDRTREIIETLIQMHPTKSLRKIFHTRNVGRGGTVADGMRQAHGRMVGFIDIDLEVHARYIPSCLRAIENGADIAVAHRVYKFHLKALTRYLLSRGYIVLVRRLLNVPLHDTESGFKFFIRQHILPILDEIEDQKWFWDTEIMVRSYYHRLNIVEIPALFIRRFDKASTVHPLADTIEYFRKLWRFRKTLKNRHQGYCFDKSPTRDRVS